MIDKDKIKYIHIKLIYLPNRNKKEKLRIFGSEFIKNNKNKCKIIFNNSEYELKEMININNFNINDKIIEIKLNGILNINDMSYMFHNCENLISLPDIHLMNTTNVNNMEYLFYYCSSLESLPNISFFNTLNVSKM